MFEVKSKTEVSNINNLINTIHNSVERSKRTEKIMNIIGGFGIGLYSFIVDTNHPNGNEIHTITSNGIIIIQNEQTKRFVTSLIARPNQIKRYFVNGQIPIIIYNVINKAREHQMKGYNSW